MNTTQKKTIAIQSPSTRIRRTNNANSDCYVITIFDQPDKKKKKKNDVE